MRIITVILLVPLPMGGKIAPVERFEHSETLKKVLDVASPPFPEYLGNEPVLMGTTYWDLQRNESLGRNVATDEYGGAHLSFTRASTMVFSDRGIFYNYYGPDGERIPGIETTGARIDPVTSISGYTTIDAYGCTPFLAYHKRDASDENYHSQVAWDRSPLETDCSERWFFAEATPRPPTVPFPDYPEEIPDLINIWPVISVSEFDGDLHLVSTSSWNSFIVDGSDTISGLGNILVYHHANIDDVDISSIDFDDAGIILGESYKVSADIATARSRDEVAIAVAYEGGFTCNWVDSINIVLYRSTDDGVTWDTTFITNNDDCYTGAPLDTIYSLKPHRVTDTLISYTRPIGEISIVYDMFDNIHIVWTEGMYSPQLTGMVAVSWPLTTLKHWSEETGEINNPMSAYPWANGLYLSPYGGVDNPNFFRNNFHPTISVGTDDNLYVIWHRYNAELLWMEAVDLPETDTVYYDMSSIGAHNLEIMGSYSPDNGETWIGPAPISNTYSPGCEPGDCKSEVYATVAEDSDDFVHISFLLDKDAGISIHEIGEVLEGDFMYVRIPTEDFEAACDAFDDFHFVCEPMYPDSTFGHDFVNPWGMTEGKTSKPGRMRLHPNYPNPFNAATNISFEIAEAGDYIIEIYDISGRLVDVPINGELGKGNYKTIWQMPENMPSGNYLMRLRNDKGLFTARRLTYVK